MRRGAAKVGLVGCISMVVLMHSSLRPLVVVLA